jgi:TolB protein
MSLYVVNDTGGAPSLVTDGVNAYGNPDWHPDGASLLCAGVDGIYSFTLSGAAFFLGGTGTYDEAPRWSPDGTTILFQASATGDARIYSMLADGSNVTQLTDGVSEEEPAWSPDGTQIIFRSYRDGNGEIYVANADGSAPTNLTLDAANDDAPHWR